MFKSAIRRTALLLLFAVAGIGAAPASCAGQSSAGPAPAPPSKARTATPQTATSTADEPGPTNVILMIGDGMGLAQIHAGAAIRRGQMAMFHYDHMGLVETRSASHYVTDSAAAGTAMATGVSTTNGFVGLDPEQKPHPSILSLAKAAGMATGIVVSTSAVDATPAAFFAHHPDRWDGEAIALDFVDAPPDVFIGGGRRYFNARSDGRNLLDNLKRAGYAIAASREELENESSDRLAAFLFDDKPPPVSNGRGDFLPAAVTKAIALLSGEPDGFFLMVEGAQIDSGGHARDLTYQSTETADFDDAVAVALAFSSKRTDTLVIVTADHETGGLTITNGNPQAGTVEGAYGLDNHSGIMVPIFASGNSAGLFSGVYRNTDIFEKIRVARKL